jgi:hypothetical protein
LNYDLKKEFASFIEYFGEIGFVGVNSIDFQRNRLLAEQNGILERIAVCLEGKGMTAFDRDLSILTHPEVEGCD